MKETSLESNSFPVADALIDELKADQDKQEAFDKHEAITDPFLRGEADPRATGLARETQEYAIYFAELKAKEARERANNGGQPLTRTQRLLGRFGLRQK